MKRKKKKYGKSPEGVSNAFKHQANSVCVQVANALFETLINNMLTLIYYLSSEHTKARAHR